MDQAKTSALCAYFAIVQQFYYLWRPQLKDPGDDMVLELAVTANCNYIITYNVNDFKGIEKFGVKAITPKEFLELVGEL